MSDAKKGVWPIVRGAFPRLLADEIVSVQPMTGVVPSGLFDIHFLTPEETKERFEAPVVWAPGESGWRRGHVYATVKDGQWMLAWWEDAPPLCGCIPSIEAKPNVWLANRPGLYAPAPEGTVMVTLGEARGGVTVATVLCVPVEKEAEMRTKMAFSPLPPAGPLY